MKNLKKLGLLILLAAVLTSIFMAKPKSALAAVAPGDIPSATFKFIDGAHIEGDFGASGKVTFFDKNPSDNTGSNYRLRNFVPQTSDFCDPGDVSGKNGVPGNAPYGIDLSSNNLTAATVPAYLKLAVKVDGACDKKNAYLLKIDVDNKDALAATDFQWSSDGNITSLDGTGGRIFRPAPNVSQPLYVTTQGDPCKTDGAILLDSPGSNSGTLYDMTYSRTGLNSNVKDYPDLAATDAGQAGAFDACHITGKTSVTIAGTAGSSTAGGAGGSVTGGGSAADDACVQKSHIGLEWILCPVVNSTIGAIGETNQFIEDQLDFKTHSLLTPDVHKAWSVFKDLISAIIVILMLVMIISQAIGDGPFSAYTIKKLLPKLVIAIIAMQLSWDLCIWLINLADDAGKGIAQIIAAPFGGQVNLGLPHLLLRLDHAWAAATLGGILILAIFSTTIGVLFLPGVLLMIFSAFMTVLIALISLLFRNVLIIALVMMSPIAFLAWVLPGTQKYWKMWTDNFTKILLLFPIMMSLIYGGRVFSYVVGGLGHAGFLDFVMVLVGFFVPYGLLPKAFKWGGNFMSMAYRATSDSGPIKKLRDTGNRMIGQDFNKYWQGRMARDLYSPYDKTAKVSSFKGIPIMGGRLAGRLGSQHLMPTAHGRAQTLREGKTWADERREDARAFNRRRFELGLEKGYAVDDKRKSFIPDVEHSQTAVLPDGVHEVDKDGNTGKLLGRDGHYVKDEQGNWRQLGQMVDADTGQLKSTIWSMGTGAAKQALVDMTSIANSGNERISKDAVEQLINTSSNPEIEHATISYGSDAGKRVYEAGSDHDHLGAWEKEVGGSQTLYPEEAKANYDLQVHLLRNAYGGGGPDILDRKMIDRMNDLGDTEAARDLKSRFASKRRTRMAPHHQSLFNIGHDMGIDSFGTQSLGWWQRQLRHATEAKTVYGDEVAAGEIGQALSGRFADIAKLGEAGASILRPLMGGEKGKEVNKILALDPSNIKDWRPVERPDGSLEWEAVHKTVEDFAQEAHTPGHVIPTRVSRPTQPPTSEQAAAARSEHTAGSAAETEEPADEHREPEAAPHSAESSAPSTTPSRTSSTGAEEPANAQTGADQGQSQRGTTDATQTPIQVEFPKDITVSLHPQSFQGIENAVARGFSQSMGGVNLGGGQMLDEDMKNEIRRLHSAIVEGNASREQQERYDQLRQANPHIDPETGEEVPMGGA